MRKRTWMLGISAGVTLVSTAALVACGGDDNTITNVYYLDGGTSGLLTLADGAIAGKILIDSITTAPNTACPAGGTTIQIGSDTNGNGTLDPSEITSTQEVCSKAQILTTTTPTGADEKCAFGGTIVQSGADTNGDGILQPGEVTSTQELCGGGFGATLTTTTALPVGSSQCPLGGVETETGVDNGANGGVAGDGILQPGEVTSTTDTCTTAPGFDVGSFAPPAAVTNQPAFTLSSNGGTGFAGNGGSANQVYLDKGGSLGGHLKVFKTGLADASFTLPAYTPKYGAVKYDVTANATLTTTAPTTFPAYYVSNSTLIYATDASTTAIVTGLHVAAGVTLTMPANVNLEQLANDIVVEGTIAAPVTATTGVGASITLSAAGAFVGATTGKITTAGATGTTANSAGGSGGSITIYASYILNQAALDSSGGAATALTGTATGSAGGSAGQITLTTDGNTYFGDDDDDDDDDLLTRSVPHLQPAASVGAGVLYNTATLTANGGAGVGTGTGGSGGTVVVRSGQGGLYNSGNVSSVGAAGVGNGAAGSGGSVGFDLDFGSGPVGLYNSGSITTTGGSASTTCTTTACTGGSGGTIHVQASGGTLVTSGAFTASGGSSVNAAGTGGSANGGSGGSIDISLTESESYDGSGYVYATLGNVLVSGSLASNGGNGAVGGSGGEIHVNMDSPVAPSGQEMQLLGYTDIFTNGGDGTTGGGNGGYTFMRNNATRTNSSTSDGTGAVIDYANVTSRGGKGSTTSSQGGSGGYVDFVSSSNAFSGTTNNVQAVVSFGAIDVSGGNGFASGGASGSLTFSATDGVQNAGAITVVGGSAAGVGGYAGTTNQVVFSTGGQIVSSGAIVTAGGNGTGATSYGGSCNGVYFNAQGAITSNAALSCTGGNSTGEVGGTGGNVIVTSRTNQLTSATTATYSAAGGTGTTAGAAGTVSLDGVTQ